MLMVIVAMLELPGIDAELKAGRLQTLGDYELETGRAYYICQPRKRNLGTAANALRQSLLTQ